MTTPEHQFRRNFAIAAVLHVVVIGAVVLFSDGFVSRPRSDAVAVEFMPADILGDMPVGPGVGCGQFTAPAPEAGEPARGTPSAVLPRAEEGFSSEETVAPAPAAPAAPSPLTPPAAPIPNAMSVTTKKPTVKVATPTATAKTDKPSTASGKTAGKTKSTATATAKSSASGSATGTGTAGSASAIRNRLAGALASAGGGTAYGDNRQAGGGHGSSPVIGSPNGSADGVANGVGKGTPFWWYFQHVHDRMYEAWEQPGEAIKWNKNLVATVLLRISRDGRIVEVKLQDPSGNKVLDESALSAARGVLRLDPPPPGLGGDPAEITVNFRLES